MSNNKDKDLQSQTKKIIYKFYLFLKELSQKEDLTADYFKRTQEVTAEACGVSLRSVIRICSEARKSIDPGQPELGPRFSSPRKTYKRAKYASELNDFDADVVRKTVHDFYDKGEYPTSMTILDAVKRNLTSYTGCVRSLQRLLTNLNFVYVRCNGRKLWVERDDVVAVRCKFLREICALRENEDSRPVVYLDEAWSVDWNRPVGRVNGFGKDCPTSAVTTAGNVLGRFMVVQPGRVRYGYVAEGTKPQVSRLDAAVNSDVTTADDRTNAGVFKNLFVQLLNCLEEPSVIVTANVSGCSESQARFPPESAKKAAVQKWFAEKNVEFSPHETLAELKQRMKGLKHLSTKYEIDELASAAGHQVIRVPPCHSQYNPIQTMRVRIKEEIAKRGKKSKSSVDIDRLTDEALDVVSQTDWEESVKKVERLQDEDNKKEIRRENLTGPILEIILQEDSNIYSYDEEDDLTDNTD